MGLRFNPSGRIILILAFVFFLGFNAQGKPVRGRYMWVRCKPGEHNANCQTEKGPWIDLPDSRAKDGRTNSRAEKITELLPTEELSGDGSGAAPTEIGSGDQWLMDAGEANSGVITEEGSALDYEESSPNMELDYSDFIFPRRVPVKHRHPQDLKPREENLFL
nr:PREDICTED: serglycin [Lepisosteus oculatus]